MEGINDKIERLEAILVARKAPVLGFLRPGLKRQQILNTLVANGIDVNESLISLLEWHNGTVDYSEGMSSFAVEILPMGIFYSLENMLAVRKDVIRWNYKDDAGDFLPIFGSWEDDLFLLKNSTGEIYSMAPAIQVFGEFCFKSIDVMLSCIIECYENEIFKIDPEKGLLEDYDKYILVTEKYLK